MATKPTYEDLEAKVQALEREMVALKESLAQKKASFEGPGTSDVKIFESEPGDTPELADIIDTQEIQSAMDEFYALTHIGVAILDRQGNILVATGWQDICTRFHRIHPETRKNCLESDLQLANGVPPETFRLYRCKNNMWDMATPITVGDRQIGNLYLGQFLFEDEEPDFEFFRSQAAKFDFDEKKYLEALKKVPRWSKETVETVMRFYTKLAHLISDLGYSNYRLGRTLREKNEILELLQQRERVLNETGRMAKIGGWQHDLVTGKAVWTQGIYDIIGLDSNAEPPGVAEHLAYYPPEYRKILDEAYGKTQAGAGPFDLELQVHTARGKKIWSRVYGEAVMEGGQCVQMRGTFQDITDRRKMEQEVGTARRLQSMAVLAGGIAHDYNNLLSMILGNISLARDGEMKRFETASLLDDAVEATLKAKDLTRELMTLSKGSPISKKTASIRHPLEICINEVLPFSNCTFNVHIMDDLWLVDHDASQVKYAIRNVLQNALEAMPKGGTLTLIAENLDLSKTSLKAGFPDVQGNYVQVTIKDEGQGIRKGDLPRIFEPYFSTKDMGDQKGMGLGLTIAYAVINKHDGYILVDSTPGQGTEVRIFFPAEISEQSQGRLRDQRRN